MCMHHLSEAYDIAKQIAGRKEGDKITNKQNKQASKRAKQTKANKYEDENE